MEIPIGGGGKVQKPEFLKDSQQVGWDGASNQKTSHGRDNDIF